MSKVISFMKNKNIRAILGMVIGTLIYCIGVVWILNLGKFFGGGVTGISQILTTIFKKIGVDVSMSVFILALNIPLFLIGWKGVSKRFAVLTLGSVVLQSVFVFVLEYLQTTYHLNPFATFTETGEIISNFDMLTLSLLGGLTCGVGAGITLKYGASTGGVDIISQYFSFKKNVSFAALSLSIDLSIVAVTILMPEILGGVEIAVYTIIRFIINVLVLDKVHTTYKMIKISIVTSEKEKMRVALISKFSHGVTIYDATGGYTNTQKYVFESVVSSFEIAEYRQIAHDVDPAVFITYSPISNIDGRFNKKAIA